MKYIYCALFSYIIGTVNPSFLFAKIKGFDIRKSGSGNAGGSNALITMGNKIGALCMLLDIFKGYVTVRSAQFLFPNLKYVFAISSVFCVLGHIFPFYMGFKGGKGLASLSGAVIAFSYKVFLCMLLFEIVVVLISDYICFVPISASVIFPVIYYFITKDHIGVLFFIPLALIMFCKHIENLKRIKNGTEYHISYIWKRKSEEERVKMNFKG